jgi:glyoxylase-like metal-dependent hydrolase (beta-lactamase superfamily II)
VPDEVVPGIFRLSIPLSDSPLGTVNAYAVRVPGGLCLVDCGWDTPEAYAALQDELRNLGCSIRDVHELLITHIHPDHFGLADHLARESGARVSMHRLEAVYVGARYGDVRALITAMEDWLRIHGVPPAELGQMAEGSLQMVERVGTRKPDVVLEGGEHLRWGERDFEVIWTPGHSAGLVCLYEREMGVLISSDHVLQRISPQVGLHTQSSGNPLRDYLASLARVKDLPVSRVLPGHGKPFQDLAGRVTELVTHHEERSAAIEAQLAAGRRSAYAIAERLRWRGAEGGWERLEPFQRRMALTETIAHLEYLYEEGRIGKQVEDGSVYYLAREG